MRCSYSQQKLIELLAVQLYADHHIIVRCTGDADAIIVTTVLNHAYTGGNVELIEANNAFLIMLIHFWNSY